MHRHPAGAGPAAGAAPRGEEAAQSASPVSLGVPQLPELDSGEQLEEAPWGCRLSSHTARPSLPAPRRVPAPGVGPFRPA